MLVKRTKARCCPRWGSKAVLDAVLGGDPQRPRVHRLILIIIPLSLVRQLVGKLDHPGPGANLKEPDHPEGLGE